MSKSLYPCKKCGKIFLDIMSLNNHRSCLDNKFKDYLMSNMRVVDLCAGTGAFSIALEEQGCQIVFANDYDKGSKLAYESNFDHLFFNSDIHDVKTKNIPSHEILCAGFPCQSFSLAGQKKGFEDERSNVFFKIINTMKFHKPKIVILENVKNLLSHDKGATFERIQQEIYDAGYFMKFNIISTAKVTGIPHGRERIYIICTLKERASNLLSLSFPQVPIQNMDTIIENKINVPDKYWYNERYGIYQTLCKEMTKDISTNTIYQFRRFYVRENKNSCCPTLTANMGTGGHNVPLLKQNGYVRKLTPRECFRFQGFPDSYIMPNTSDGMLYKLAGNAVTLPVVQLIAKEIKENVLFY